MQLIPLDSNRADQVQQFADCFNATFPNIALSKDEFETEWAQIPSQYYVERWRVQEDGLFLGVLQVWETFWSYEKGRFQFEFYPIDPESADLLQKFANLCIERLATLGANDRQSWASDLTPQRAKTLEGMGFDVAQEAPSTRLLVEEFDFERWGKSLDLVRERGIEVDSFEAFEAKGFDWRLKLHEALKEIRVDMPGPTEMTHISFDELMKQFDDLESRPKHLCFLAVADGEVVGYSRVTPSKQLPKVMFTGFTGVARSHRRMGVASALKVVGVQACKAAGFVDLRTDNDSTNPMLQLNFEMGFKVFENFKMYRKLVSVAD